MLDTVAPVVDPQARRWLVPAQVVLLLVLVAAAYSGVLGAGYVWDDDKYVTENPTLEDAGGLVRIWTEPSASPQYYPLVFTSFWVERRLFGQAPGPSHAVNVALHALNALLLWGILRRARVPGAYAAAVVFAVHPVHVESVAWITERKNVLSGAFYLSSALVFLALTLRATPTQPRALRAGVYATAFVLFAGALLSKTVTATLPVALLIVLWAVRGAVSRRDVIALAPFLALGVVMGLLTAWLEVHHVGAMGRAWNLSAVERLLLAGRAAWFYAGALLWPHPLVFIYPKWPIDAGSVIGYVPLAGVAGVVLAAWIARNRLGRWPAAAIAFFLVSLFPALGFLNVYPMRYSWVADHFQYLASMGVIALLVGALHHLARWTGRPAVAWAMTAGVVAIMVPVAHRECGKYRDAETLWQDTIAKNPSAWIAYVNLGNVRVSQGRLAEARTLFEDALRVAPDLPEAHNNLGTAWFKEGDPSRAAEHHARAVALMPGYAEAHNNLAVDLVNLGRTQEALDHFDRALELDPAYAMAHFNLANTLNRLKRPREAEIHYREAIRLRKSLALAHYYLGLTLLSSGRRAEAEGFLDTAFRLRPDFPAGLWEVGNALLAQGDAAGAADLYRRALLLKPDYAEARCNLGSALVAMGRREEAIGEFEAALRLNPEYAIAENNLGFALEGLGRTEEALQHYAAALRIDPGYATAAENLRRLRAAPTSWVPGAR